MPNNSFTFLQHSTNKFFNYTIDEIITHIKNNPTEKFYKQINDNLIEINNNIVCNTQFICHRINTMDELEQINPQFGVELDLHDEQITKNIAVYHDPFSDNFEMFENYLKKYNKNILILNIKVERIEHKCIELLQKYNITNYFFLDSTFPMIYALATKHNCVKNAIRFSEFEPIEMLQLSKSLYSWIWVDCFTKFPLNTENYVLIKNLNKKICIVSPELQNNFEKINEYRDYLINNNICVDAICCKVYNIIHWI